MANEIIEAHKAMEEAVRKYTQGDTDSEDEIGDQLELQQ